MNSSFGKLNLADLGKAVVLVVITTLLGAIQQAVTAHGFNLGDYDWLSILQVAGTAGVGYILKNLISDSSGKVMGIIG